ncbi:MAG: hypothetical protein NC251_00800 [Lachnoclostridium sp.]|nr:hypothetical protein [Lachnospira sp.]MCM1246957.1 hypothetical protein [Lachnoclostridium sp.]MCM1536020.1 hypothetical protein [Clostridium sp.]
MGFKTKFTRGEYVFLAVQLLIILAAFLNWGIHRRNLFSRDISLDEYIVAENTVVVNEVTTDALMNEAGGVFVQTPALSLKKGTYNICMNYNADRPESMVYVESSQLDFREMHYVEAELNPAYHSTVMRLDLSRDVTDLVISLSFSGKGYLTLINTSIVETTDQYQRNIVNAFALCILLNLCWLFKKSAQSSRKVMVALAAIFLATCYPLYTDYIISGFDTPFHLLRIEGIAKGLASHTFPVKIHPVWAKDYGYAAGVMYGDAFLYFPALLRCFGYSVQAAYKLYCAAINLGTVVISYFAFKAMFRSKKIGLLGCLIYSLSIYRLIDAYTRGALGECTAMMFFPLVLCGFYLIFTEASKENWYKYALLTAAGLTGLIQSHALSCEMTAFVIIPICIILIKRVFRRYTFTALASAAVLTLLLSVGFLVPFLDYLNRDLIISSDSWMETSVELIRTTGMFPSQLFMLFGHATGATIQASAGVAYEFTVSTGIFTLFGLLLFLYLLLCHYKECRTYGAFIPACICTAAGCLLLYMSTCYFPWNAIVSKESIIKTLSTLLEFPWRLLAPATVLLTFTGCFSVKVFYDLYAKSIVWSVVLAAMTLLAVNCGWYFYDFVFSGVPYRVYDTKDLNSMCLYSCDFLPEGTSLDDFEDNKVSAAEGTIVSEYQKNGTTIRCKVNAGDADGFIDFPLTCYKYYVCRDNATGEPLDISYGYNNRMRVAIPAGFNSDITICFKEPVHWRLAESVSLLTLLGICGFACYKIYRNKYKVK